MAATAKVLERMELSPAKRRLLEQRMRGTAQPLPERIAPRPPGARTPISSEQHRIWLHQAMEPDLPIYNESITVHRRGSLDLAALEAAFNEVLRRHEALRTSFGMVRGELSQVVAPELRVRLPLVDLTELPEFLREEEACRVATEDAAAPIGLSAAPLFRVKVLRLSATHHWLQLTLHHIIFDGVSIYRTLVPELAALYEAFAAGRPSPLAEPELQYADYTLWRERQLESPAMARQLEYWRRELAGELPVLRLPVDRSPSAQMSHRGAMESVTFPEKLIESLRGMGRAHGVTLYMLLLAGLKTLFFRYSGQEDVIVGGLVDGRRRPELEGVVGYFLDTFAIRTRPSAEMRFADYLRSVRHAVLGALAEAEVPFSRVVQAVQPVRDGSHHPIFQTFLAFQPHAEALAEGWEVSKTKVSVGAAKFDLYIEVEERPGNTAARFMYRTDLFDAATVERMTGHWMTLLAAAAEDPERRLGELPVLTPGERELMLGTWNERQRPVPAETLHGLVASRARRTPDAVAVEFEGARWSYAELEGRAELLAGRLRAAGVRRGELVAVCLERSQYLVAGLLAVLKTGAAYLPLDPATPRARRVLCLEDAASAAVLTQRALADDLPQTQAAMVLLEDALLEDAVPEDAATEARFAGSEGEGLDDAAYIIHTSGSTGRPKAVEISHRAVVNLLVSMEREPGFTAKDTLLAVTTVSFDIAGLELFLPLIAGGTVVVAPRAVALDPYLLGEAVERSRCTVLQATPATWRALLATGWKGRPGLKVLCGGEAMTRELANGLLGSRPGLGEAGLGMEVWNLYGPTETTIWSTAHRVTLGSGPVSVGRPIANTTAYVFDARRQPVPVGVPGELYLGGMGLANGYRGQPELTAEKFVTVDLGHGPERLYRTGDYALFRADGRIEVQGRADNQVKVRGYRIELEDVESALATHPGVGAGAAKVWPDPSGGNRLSAYLVGKAGAPPPDAAELRAYLKMRVPEYMVPSDVVALEAMPLTANGKMDRKALLAPSVTVEHVASTAPATVTERRLAAIWAELLGVGAVGMEDNFFDLGGHSLLVARLQQRIAAEFGRKLSMAAIFHAPTMARQMALLEGAGGAVDGARLIPIQPVGSKPPLYWVEPTPLIANLGRTLGTDQPLLGVTLTQEDLDTMGDEPGLEAFARRHAETIVKAQPVGPYYVGGLCVGGILAYEVAAQLTAAGHTVASLVLLDAENPVFYRRFDTLAVEAQKLVFYARRALGGKGQEMFWRHLRSRLRRLVSIADRASTEMSAIGSAILAAAFRYRPPAYRGDVLLVVPKDRPRVVNYVEGWRHVVQGRLTCADVDGHHDELLDPGFAAGVSRTMLRHFAGLGANGLDTNGLGANAS